MQAGQRLQHYRLVEQIGVGGMGVVWKAEDTRLDRSVALKLLPADVADVPERHVRFEREARAVAALNHPNIVTIFSVEDAETDDGPVKFITMELVEGRTLRELLTPGGLPVERLVEFALPLADAVRVAHAADITHRDLKPENVMLGDDGRLRVLDFGLAKLHEPLDATSAFAGAGTSATVAGQLLGTAGYMSPEQAQGLPVDPRSDLFSLGTVLYEMATGDNPFRADSAAATLGAICEREPAPLQERRPELPAELSTLVHRCLRKDPESRCSTADEVVETLRDVRTRLLSGAVDAGTGARPPGALLAGLVFAALAVALTLWVWSGGAGTESGTSADGAAATDLAANRPSIAVLSFTAGDGNHGGADEPPDYVAAGLADELTTELSRYSELHVVARSSARVGEAAGGDVRKIGAALGVRYVLDGTVRRLDERIRVLARLTSVQDGQVLWANSYNRSLTADNLFALQDELTQQVVHEVAGAAGALSRSGLAEARRKPPRNLDSYDCVLLTYEYVHAHYEANHLRARDCLEAALQVEPNYADGWAWLAYLYLEEHHHEYNERVGPPSPLARAAEAADKAIRLDSTSQVGHGVRAGIAVLAGDIERAKVDGARAIQINPNNALWLGFVGTWLSGAGEFEQGLPLVRRAIELNPNPPPFIRMATFLDHYHAGRYDEALPDALSVDTADFRTALFRAATYARLGRMQEAARAAEEFRGDWTRPLGELRDYMTGRDGFLPELVDELLEGLRMAGVAVP